MKTTIAVPKKEILNSITRELRKEFAEMVKIAMATKDAATNPESKAENKYDTRGLEASYLASAQAERAQDVRRAISILDGLTLVDYDSSTPIGSTALVQVCIGEIEYKWFFLLPQKGGIRVSVDKVDILTLSLDSPLGQLLIGKFVGDELSQNIQGTVKEYSIVSVL